MRYVIQFLAVITVVAMSQPVFARGGGGWSFGANVGIANAEQEDMDTVIDGGGTASNLGNGLEFGGSIGYQFGDVSLLLRPSYYTISEDGGGNDYSMSAITVMPFLRWDLLSNQNISFYTQLGLGWVYMFGEIKEGADSVEFSGNEIGYAGGLGAQFCFFAPHCFYLEANLRIAGVERMTVDKAGGTPTNISGIDQGGKGQELEINGRDFGASLSGIHGIVGYNYTF